MLLHGIIVWSVLFESWNGSEHSKVLKRKNQLNSKRLSSAQIACALHVHFKILDKGRIIWKKKQNSPVAITFWMMFIRMRLDFIDRMITSIDIPNITGQMRTSWKQANYMTVFRIWNQLSHVNVNESGKSIPIIAVMCHRCKQYRIAFIAVQRRFYSDNGITFEISITELSSDSSSVAIQVLTQRRIAITTLGLHTASHNCR